MTLDNKFQTNPHAILSPNIRWVPDASHSNLLPPLVGMLRKKVKEFRDDGYREASATSRTLLKWWFGREHFLPTTDGISKEFQYYFAQREAVETIIYLYDVVKVKDKHDLMRFDEVGNISANMFFENWRRFVVKMATGTGKTKVMSLILAWSFYHKLYEPCSDLARNFLIITPNIIVLDRIRNDFDGLKIFFQDPIIPDNGYEGRNWHHDFQLTLHIQDEVNVINPIGNIFLTNIHRVYSSNEVLPSAGDENTMDYFLGKHPTPSDGQTDLGKIVRNIDELVVINDEAHHIHDDKLSWFTSIQDIHHKLVQKEKFLSLQIDLTATPKHNNGAIFVQTISDYPLVEAISQNVVKHPCIPNDESCAKLKEYPSSQFTEKYSDYINLGVEEWRKAYDEYQKVGKKAILFIMTDDTKNCDDVKEYLEKTYPQFKNAVLAIHTNKSGEITENKKGKDSKELQKLRKAANEIDDLNNPYKAVVSVLMLKEGWDVRNVTTIVGLRAYSAKSNILPEQTLGRGLRRICPENGSISEQVSVVGTEAFMEFVKQIQSEGVRLEQVAMGAGTPPKAPLIIEVENESKTKGWQKLDIEIPILTNRIHRDYEKLLDITLKNLTHRKVKYEKLDASDLKEITFEYMVTGESSHTTKFDPAGMISSQSIIGYFAKTIMGELRIFSSYDILYSLVKEFIRHHLFDRDVALDNINTVRNLAQTEVTQMIIETFVRAINALIVQDVGKTDIKGYLKLSEMRPFQMKEKEYFVPQKSLLNKMVGDNKLELNFAKFLEESTDIISYAKNYFAVHFNLDYVKADGSISHYYPDFIVKQSQQKIYIIETKGLEDLDVPQKIARLKQWCEDVNQVSDIKFDFIFVDEEKFKKYRPASFAGLARSFDKYQ